MFVSGDGDVAKERLVSFSGSVCLYIHGPTLLSAFGLCKNTSFYVQYNEWPLWIIQDVLKQVLYTCVYTCLPKVTIFNSNDFFVNLKKSLKWIK